MKEINVQSLFEKTGASDFDAHSIIVDVRVPGEFHAERIPSSINIPLYDLEKRRDELSKYEHVYLHCETGGRSEDATQILEELALHNWVNIHGGIELWRQHNLPTIKDGAMSMQRQIMIVAGSLILIGAGLSFWKFGFIAIPLFVGAGLTFAGITNNCGLAVILRMMPWNTKQKDTPPIN